jgi:hypothetical protein
MPELGDNAIYKEARAITKIENYKFQAEKDCCNYTLNYGEIDV